MARKSKVHHWLREFPRLLPPLVLLLPATGHSAAAWLTESGGADMGMAGAGRPALALDAAALAANPAAIASLHGTEVTAAYLPVRINFDFQGDAANPGSYAHESTTPAGSLFGAWQAGRVSLGLGAYSPAGAGFDYGHQWAGRYTVEDAQLRTLNVAGALAYRVTGQLDVGATLAAQYADVNAAVAVNNAAAIYGPPLGLPDGQVKMTGGSWQPAGSVGLLYRLAGDTRVGLAWTAPVRHAASLDVHASGLHPVLATLVPASSTAELDLTLPQQVALGVARQVTPATLVGIGAGWQDWSAFGHSSLSLLDSRMPMFAGGLKDTWNVSVGLRHQFNPAWNMSMGVAYDSSPSTQPTMPAYFPVAEQWRLAVGAEHHAANGLVVRAALSVIDQADVRVSQTTSTWPLPGATPFGGTVRGNRAYVLCIASDFAL